MMDDRQQANNVQGLIDNFKKLLALNLDYARLTAAEKLTILLSTIAFYSMVCILGTLVLIFVSIGVGHLLATTVARVAAYLYVAGFYMVLFILLFVFRKKIFIDPTARFISKLFVKPPEE
ncbi:MAG: phage holin family protein [Muribaculaceae bacterium]